MKRETLTERIPLNVTPSMRRDIVRMAKKEGVSQKEVVRRAIAYYQQENHHERHNA